MLSRRNAGQASAGAVSGELPFLQLWRLLEGLRLEPNLQSQGPSSSSLLVNHDTAQTSAPFGQLASRKVTTNDLTTMHEQTVGPILSSLLPQSHLEALPNTTTPLTKADHMSAAYLKLLIYAATNNFAGVEHLITLPMMYDYLRPMVAKFLEMNIANSAHSGFAGAKLSLKPMAETLFRCAVEAGDAVALKDLCLRKELGIDVNKQVITVGNHRYTPLERAAIRGFFETTEVLISVGADVNKSFVNQLPCRSDFDEVFDLSILKRYPRGPLEHVVQQRRKLRPAEGKILRLLMRTGASIAVERLIQPIRDGHLKRVLFIVNSRMDLDAFEWTKKGLFHRLLQEMSDSGCMSLIENVVAAGVDLNHAVPVGNEVPFWIIPKHPAHMIDAAIERGHAELVQEMIRNGAAYTVDSLTAAVRSRNVDFVNDLLNRDTGTNQFSMSFRSTPYAEAIRLGDTHLMSRLVEAGCLDDSHVHYRHQLVAMMVAAAEIGDIGMVQQLIPDMVEDTDALGYALIKAVENENDLVAEALLSAGAKTGSLIYDTAFNPVFGLPACLAPEFNLHPDYRGDPHPAPEPILEATVKRDNYRLFAMLIEHDAAFDNALTLAIQLNRSWMVQQLIVSSHPDVSSGADRGRPVVLAISKHDIETVKLLATAGYSLREALEEAIISSSTEMICQLIQLGAKPRARTMVLALKRAPEVFQLLWETFRHMLDKTAIADILNLAVVHGKLEIVQSLVQWIPGIATYIDSHARQAAETQSLVRQFLYDIRLSPLATAILNDDDPTNQTLGLLLETGVALDAVVASEGRTLARPIAYSALLLAITANLHGIVALFIRYGANVNQLPILGIKRTPLQKAAEVGSACIVRTLLRNGADPNGQPSARGGGTALQFAAIGGFIGIFELLLEHGADPNAPCSKVNGRMPLEGAAEHGRFDMVAYILQLSVRPQPEVDKAVKLARGNGHSAIANILERQSLQDKVARIDEISTEARACDICQITLSNASARARHESTVHGDVFTRAKHSCETCGRTFGRKDLFERHKTTHSKQGYVTCDVCGKQFRKDYLKAHLPGCQKRIPCNMMV